jgi:hypothetical protein
MGEVPLSTLTPNPKPNPKNRVSAPLARFCFISGAPITEELDQAGFRYEIDGSVFLVVAVSSYESATFRGGGHFCGRVARLATRQGFLHFPSPTCYLHLHCLARFCFVFGAPIIQELDQAGFRYQIRHSQPPHPTPNWSNFGRKRVVTPL